jgi:hypothetical protein
VILRNRHYARAPELHDLTVFFLTRVLGTFHRSLASHNGRRSQNGDKHATKKLPLALLSAIFLSTAALAQGGGEGGGGAGGAGGGAGGAAGGSSGAVGGGAASNAPGTTISPRTTSGTGGTGSGVNSRATHSPNTNTNQDPNSPSDPTSQGNNQKSSARFTLTGAFADLGQ